MPQYSKAKAARMLKVSRTTLYRLIDEAHVTVMPNGLIDATELVRVAPLVDTLKARHGTDVNSDEQIVTGVYVRQETSSTVLSCPDLSTSVSTSNGASDRMDRPDDAGPDAHNWTPVPGRHWTSEDELASLREQVKQAQRREQESAAREQYYQAHIAWLQTEIGQTHVRYERLLSMPAATAVTAPETTRPLVPDRGARRRQIVALLAEYPDGLSPAEVRASLGLSQSLGSTIIAMARDGLIHRCAPGRYRCISRSDASSEPETRARFREVC